MDYLLPSEYQAYGLEPATPQALITMASTIIDAHCRRPTLAPAQYQERLRVRAGRNTLPLTYLPLVAIAPAASPIISLRARYASARPQDWPWGDSSSNAAALFGLPGAWIDLNLSETDICSDTGELTLPINALGLGFCEVEAVYTAGLSVLPGAVKTACAQLVRNTQATPALNVRSGRVDQMYMEYFSESLIDETVRALLSPYVAQKVG